MWCFGERIVSS
ncbi:unnamed protein product [Ophioblennius macclurei]